MCDRISSKFIHIMCSVLQVSVLGPVFSILYIEDLVDITAEHKLSCHTYADDNQLYIHC